MLFRSHVSCKKTTTVVSFTSYGDKIGMLSDIASATAKPASGHSLSGSALGCQALHHLFEETARRFPNRRALEFNDTSWTYAELNQSANRLAAWLIEEGVGRGQCVPIWLPRGPLQQIAMLAVLKAGAAYVPIDAGCPPDRVAFVVGDCAARVFLSHSSHPVISGSVTTVGVDLAFEALPSASSDDVHDSTATTSPDDLAYVIYTSGTTGLPKGVEIQHSAVIHLVEQERQLFGITPEDRVLQGFSIAFDASIEEIWLAYAAGATLVLADEERMRNGLDLPSWLIEKEITVVSTVPTLLSMWIRDVPKLRLLILGGETFSNELAQRWIAPDRRVVNTYGPTEATVIATVHECAAGKTVTLGRPLPGCHAMVVNEIGVSCPAGEAGELFLSGPQLARGYLARPDLTAEKFVHRCDDDTSTRWYRTGDAARFQPSGEIEFLGRIDAQIKLRGYRIELGEIEAVLSQITGVQAAAVAPHGDAAAPVLAAFLVLKAGSPFDEAAARAFLHERLPEYMCPALFTVLERLPVTTTGKLDRRALVLPEHEVPSRRSIRAPETEVGGVLHKACSELFPGLAVSMDDDFFFDLGGHSLAAARLVSRLRLEPAFAHASIIDVYHLPKLADLAAKYEWPAATRHETSNEPAVNGQTNDAMAGAKAAPQKRRNSVPPLRHFLCGLGQFFALYPLLGFISLQWLSPYLTFSIARWEGALAWEAAILAALALVVLYPVMLMIGVIAKWVLLGRIRPGVYPLWGWFYFRWWLVQSLLSAAPRGYLEGTPLLPLYMRWLGAKIGRNVFLASDSLLASDLISIGDHSSIGADVSLAAATVEDGALVLAPITIGRDCLIGTRAVIRPGVTLEDRVCLEPLSMVTSGAVIRSGETWAGSPASRVVSLRRRKDDSQRDHGGMVTWKSLAAALLGVAAFPMIFFAGTFPGMFVMWELNAWDYQGYSHLIVAPLVALLFVLTLGFEIVVAKWLLLGRVQAGDYPIYGPFYWRKWFVDRLMDMSIDVLGPAYSTIFIPPWYRLLGAKVGKNVEISTASFISPDLLEMGDESFIADIVSLGAPEYDRGVMTLDVVRIGRRAFVGNSALVPAGTILADNSLLGCLSLAPHDASLAARPNESWLGSPSFLLPRRHEQSSFSEEATFRPSGSRQLVRAAIQLVRILLPTTGFVALTNVLLGEVAMLQDHYEWWLIVPWFPLMYAVAGAGAFLFVVAAKWLVVRRYRPSELPLFSHFVSLSEMVTGLYEYLAVPFLLGSLAGTPMLPWCLRALGARFGRRVYCDTTQFTEFDLVDVGDEAILNDDTTLQTHLFEDRVMKMSYVRVGADCTIGGESLILYDSKMEPSSTIGDLSLVMKGESLPAGSDWAGIPARRA